MHSPHKFSSSRCIRSPTASPLPRWPMRQRFFGGEVIAVDGETQLNRSRFKMFFVVVSSLVKNITINKQAINCLYLFTYSFPYFCNRLIRGTSSKWSTKPVIHQVKLLHLLMPDIHHLPNGLHLLPYWLWRIPRNLRQAQHRTGSSLGGQGLHPKRCWPGPTKSCVSFQVIALKNDYPLVNKHSWLEYPHVP